MKHLYVIASAAYPRWRKLGWRLASGQPDNTTGVLIENRDRYPLYPCSGCDQEISELRHTAFAGRCVDCYDDADARVVLH